MGSRSFSNGGGTKATRGPRSSLPRWPAGPGEAAIIHGMSPDLFQQFPLLVLCEHSRGSWSVRRPVARMTAGGIRRSAGHLGINMRPQPFLPLPSFLCLSLPSFFAFCDPMSRPFILSCFICCPSPYDQSILRGICGTGIQEYACHTKTHLRIKGVVWNAQ